MCGDVWQLALADQVLYHVILLNQYLWGKYLAVTLHKLRREKRTVEQLHAEVSERTCPKPYSDLVRYHSGEAESGILIFNQLLLLTSKRVVLENVLMLGFRVLGHDLVLGLKQFGIS